MAEDIITALSRFPDLVVVARTSSFAYKGKAVDVRQVGKDLGVGYVVEGSVRKDGDKLRIVAQLIDAKTCEHVWAERFDRSGPDPWALQDEVTGMIVSAITGEKGALKQGQYRQAWGKDATTLEEYDYYLRGHEQYMKYAQGDKEGIERSGEIWREGLAKFPSSPLLKVKLGWHHMMRVMIFVSDDPPADIRKAGELARQALAKEHLSPQVARLANWLMSYVLVLEREFDGALAAADKTVAMAPNDTFMLSRLMMVLVQVGRPDQALQWADQAAARDPALGWCYNYGRGWAYLVLGRFRRGGGCSDANRIQRRPSALGDRLRAPWPHGRRPSRGSENDEDQSRDHVASLAAGTFLPRSCSHRPLFPRSRAIGLAGDIAPFRPAERRSAMPNLITAISQSGNIVGPPGRTLIAGLTQRAFERSISKTDRLRKSLNAICRFVRWGTIESRRRIIMSRDPGRLQRAISELIESSGPGDVGWTTSWLCEHVYGGKSSKSQRTALIRAIKTMKLPVGWKFERGWDELQLINDERFHARSRRRE